MSQANTSTPAINNKASAIRRSTCERDTIDLSILAYLGDSVIPNERGLCSHRIRDFSPHEHALGTRAVLALDHTDDLDTERIACLKKAGRSCEVFGATAEGPSDKEVALE